MDDEHQNLREKVAEQYKIQLYKSYREKQAVDILGYEVSWFKRHRKANNIPYIQDAGGGISYLGLMLCDMIILGKEAKALWENTSGENSSSESTTSPKEEGLGTERGSTGGLSEKLPLGRMIMGRLKKD